MLEKLRWGLLQFWAKDKTLGHTTINARVETVANKPAFRFDEAFLARSPD